MYLEAPSQEYYMNDLHILTERKTRYIYIYRRVCDYANIMNYSRLFLLSLHPFGIGCYNVLPVFPVYLY